MRALSMLCLGMQYVFQIGCWHSRRNVTREQMHSTRKEFLGDCGSDIVAPLAEACSL